MQSFTVRMPLLTATSAFALGRRRWSSVIIRCDIIKDQTKVKNWQPVNMVNVIETRTTGTQQVLDIMETENCGSQTEVQLSTDKS